MMSVLSSLRVRHASARLSAARRLLASVLAVLALSLVMAPSAAALGNNLDASGQVNPVIDILLLRPLGIVATAHGVAFFLVAAPIVALTRPSELGVPFEWLVMKPVRYTWIDPLGDHASPKN